MNDKITFSFGENWKDYLATIGEDDINRSKQDIEEWLSPSDIRGKTIVDIGSGSGLHSLSYHLLGSKSVYSLDYDPHSVEATRQLWEKSGKPKNWSVSHRSILAEEEIKELGNFDIVYSWGVLHHTGAMWKALDNCFSLVAPGGVLWVSLYTKGPHYRKHLGLKQRYNKASEYGKRWMVNVRIARRMLSRIGRCKNPLSWNQDRGRGMKVYHDIVDWLGGLPYEVAAPDEVLQRGRSHGFVLERIKIKREGSCSGYLFSKPKA